MNLSAEDRSRPEQYAKSARILHWLMAVCFFFMWGSGYAMTSFVQDDSALQELLFGLHISTGVSLLFLLVAEDLDPFYQHNSATTGEPGKLGTCWFTSGPRGFVCAASGDYWNWLGRDRLRWPWREMVWRGNAQSVPNHGVPLGLQPRNCDCCHA